MRHTSQFNIIGIYVLILLGFDHHILVARTMAESPEAITLPSSLFTFQSAPGSEIASSYCLICHTAEYVYTQPPHSRVQWNEIVKKMKQVFGCPIPAEHIPTLVDYLVNQNTIQPTPKPKVVKNIPSLQKNDKGNPINGEVIYNTSCTNCHGSQGKGDGPIGQSLIPPAADLTATGKKSEKELLDVIRNGRPGTAMPSWKENLSDAEVHDVLSYIQTLSP